MKDAERQKATELFGTAAEPSALASKVGRPQELSLLNTNFTTDNGRQITDIRHPVSKWHLDRLVFEEHPCEAYRQGAQEGGGDDQECKEFAGYHKIREGAE